MLNHCKEYLTEVNFNKLNVYMCEDRVLQDCFQSGHKQLQYDPPVFTKVPSVKCYISA